MAVDGDGGTLNTSPSADAGTPANDGVKNTGVVLDLGVLEDNRLLDTRTGADVDAGADGDVGAELSGGVDRGSGVDKDGRDNVSRAGRELLGAGLEGLLEVESVGGHSGSSRLDLAPEVLGLVDEELLVIGKVTEDVLLEADDTVLVTQIVVEDHAALEVIGARIRDEAGSVSSALDSILNAGEDSLSAEQVDTAVNEVADVTLGLLDVVKNTASVGIGDDASEVAGGLIGDLGAENNGLGVLLNEELEHVDEREGAANIGVEDEKALGAALQNGVTEVVETTCSAKSLVLAEVLDGETGEFKGGILDEVLEDLLLVVADDVHLLEVLGGELAEGGDAVPDDWVAGDLKERLGDVETEGSESSAAGRTANLRRERNKPGQHPTSGRKMR